MKLMSYSNVINLAFKYVINTSKQFNIDESHSLKHSMDVFHTANKIYNSELQNSPYLSTQKTIIDVSAILHDMCDKKYVDEYQSTREMNIYMQPYITTAEMVMVNTIISTMSYSTVNKKGFPVIPEYQLAYHIVREADLLCAFDPDRCIMYGMMKENLSYIDATKRAIPYLENRVLQYIDNGLFITDYSKEQSVILHKECKLKLDALKQLVYYSS
jgi:hypothetical protein